MRFLALLLISFGAQASTFKIQSLDAQLRESSGVLIGHYLKSKTVKLDDGIIATQVIIKINKEFGLQSDEFGMNEVIIHYPGGEWNDVVTKVDGVPSFVTGEKVAVMIKSIDNRYWGLNLGMGAYKVINYGKDTILVNSLFPQNPIVGQINLVEFERKVKEAKGSDMKEVVDASQLETSDEMARTPASLIEGKKRTIASKADESENEDANVGLNVYWLLLLLAVLGGGFRLVKNEAR